MYHAQAATHIDSLKIQIRCHTDIEVALQTQPGETQSHRQGILQHNKTMIATRHDFINVSDLENYAHQPSTRAHGNLPHVKHHLIVLYDDYWEHSLVNTAPVGETCCEIVHKS